MITALMIILTLGVGPFTASYFEWVLHKYILHRHSQFFKKWFQLHTRKHHMVFTFDETYHLQNPENKPIIGMWFWGPLLVILDSLHYFLITFLLHLYTGIENVWIVSVAGFFVFGVYYLVYESVHHCFHLPKNRQIEKARVYQRLNAHHLLHHCFMNKNFNVVSPFADWTNRTLLVRSPINFKQPRGPAVPDVQPLRWQTK